MQVKSQLLLWARRRVPIRCIRTASIDLVSSEELTMTRQRLTTPPQQGQPPGYRLPAPILAVLAAVFLIQQARAQGTPAATALPAPSGMTEAQRQEIAKADKLSDQGSRLLAAKKMDEALAAAKLSLEIRLKAVGRGHSKRHVGLIEWVTAITRGETTQARSPCSSRRWPFAKGTWAPNIQRRASIFLTSPISIARQVTTRKPNITTVAACRFPRRMRSRSRKTSPSASSMSLR